MEGKINPLVQVVMALEERLDKIEDSVLDHHKIAEEIEDIRTVLFKGKNGNGAVVDRLQEVVELSDKIHKYFKIVKRLAWTLGGYLGFKGGFDWIPFLIEKLNDFFQNSPLGG